MRYLGSHDPIIHATTIALEPNCYLDSEPLVRLIEFHNAEFDVADPSFALACAILTRNYCGEVFDLDGWPMAPDVAEAIRTMLPQTPNVGPVDGLNRALWSGTMDIHCGKAGDLSGSRTPELHGTRPFIQIDWSGDFVDRRSRSGEGHQFGRYVTNAELIADAAEVSIALALLHGGPQCRTIEVPLARGADPRCYAPIIAALEIVAVTLRLGATPGGGPTNPQREPKRSQKRGVATTRTAAPAAAAWGAPADAAAAQAVIMIAHSDNPRITDHFNRLRREVCPVMPAYFALHTADSDAHPCADIVLTDQNLTETFPARRSEMLSRGLQIPNGYEDTVVMTAVYHPALDSFTHVWVIEYDVDVSGDWGSLLKELMTSKADLIGARFAQRNRMLHWANWHKFGAPADVRLHIGGFMPLRRVSRRFAQAYRAEVQRPGWSGHAEATVPTAAVHLGMSIEDLMPDGDFSTSPQAPMTHETFGFRPPRSQSYFHEAPEAFKHPNLLYHPVKIAGTGSSPAPETAPAHSSQVH